MYLIERAIEIIALEGILVYRKNRQVHVAGVILVFVGDKFRLKRLLFIVTRSPVIPYTLLRKTLRNTLSHRLYPS